MAKATPFQISGEAIVSYHFSPCNSAAVEFVRHRLAPDLTFFAAWGLAKATPFFAPPLLTDPYLPGCRWRWTPPPEWVEWAVWPRGHC